jgi:hypothetical protein
MDVSEMAYPGREAMRAQVRRQYGNGEALDALQYQFSYWLTNGENTPEAVREPVEGAVAGYFAKAAAVGKWWGIGLGAGAGLSLWALAAVVVLLVKAIA